MSAKKIERQEPGDNAENLDEQPPKRKLDAGDVFGIIGASLFSMLVYAMGVLFGVLMISAMSGFMWDW